MTSRQHWPKPDLLQQRRLELGLPLELRAVEALPRLLLKGAAPAVVLLLTPIALVLFFAHQPRRFEAAWLRTPLLIPWAPCQCACSSALSSSWAPLRSAWRRSVP